MILGFLFREAQRTLLAGIELDVMENESLNLDGQVTRYPVEDGTEISDHIFVKSQVLEISGLITHIDGYTFGTSLGKSVRLSEILDEFKNARDKRQTFDVITGLRKYSDMAFESLKFDRSNDGNGGNWLKINAKMVEVVKVKLQTADVPAAEQSTRNRAGQTATPAGRNTPSAEGAPQQQGPQRAQSLAVQGRNAIDGAGGIRNILGLPTP